MNFCRLAILFLALTASASNSLAERNCVVRTLESILVKPVKKYSGEVKTYVSESRKDWRRAFVKDAPLNSPKSEPLSWKLFHESPKTKWYLQALFPDTYFQLPTRALSKIAVGKAYDFVPVGTVVKNLERTLVERWLKMPGKKLTKPMHFITASVAFPLTGFGIFTAYEYYKLHEIARFSSPDYLSAFDQRFSEANELTDYTLQQLKEHPQFIKEFKKKTGLTSLARDSILKFQISNLNRERMVLSDYMQTASKNGLNSDHPDVLLTLSGDSEALKRMAERFANESIKRNQAKNHQAATEDQRKILTEIYQQQLESTVTAMNTSLLRDAGNYTSVDWLLDPPENLKVQTPILTNEQKQKVYQIQLDLLHAKEILYANPKIKERIAKFFNPDAPDPSPLVAHLKDPFIADSLKTYIKDGKTNDDLAAYHASQYLDWVAKMQMLKVIGATQYSYEYVPNGTSEPDVRLTNQPMTLEKAEKEILHDPIGAQNLTQKMIEYQKWKKKD